MRGFEWALAILALIAASAAIIAAGLALGRLGVLMGLFAAHLGRCLRQMGLDFVRVIGGTIVALIMLPVALARLASGTRDAARDALRAAGREAHDALRALYSLVLVQPLRLVGLRAIVGHVESRLPAALSDNGAAGVRTSAVEFDGYAILRELKAGGSGARIFVCEPDARTRVRIGLAEGEVVIKSFGFDDGTRLAEMLRESRALDAARRLGLILDHDSSERRFHYVMRFYPGLDLGKFTRRTHELVPDGRLDREQFVLLASLVRDLVATLRDWHASGLWHKDVKPENIIVHEGRATLIDLSLVTPLASQMTLTTHGTEYFRDPEMVRQALRGVRVSEVDAARFDLYGAGAVLHFVLEGTFPAHGVLSGFRKPSPECLRWIARRAMADFDRRYANADEMLRDLDRAILGGDPAAVRPADLPSMQGTMVPTPPGALPLGATPTRAFAPDAPRTTPPTVPPPPDSASLGRPRFRVTNWWTGAYQMASLRPLPASFPAKDRRKLGPPLAVLLAALLMLGAVLALWSWWEERLERQDTVLPRVLVNPPSAWFSDPPPRVPATQSVTPSVAPAAEPTSEPTSPPTSPPTSEPPPST
jgi:serine/threonine protein kinase